jgi:ribosomal protein L32
MSNSRCKNCGSYAINHHLHGRDGSRNELCDVCYWREKYGELEQEFQDAKKLAKHILLFLVENKGYTSTFSSEKELLIKEAKQIIERETVNDNITN